MYQPAAFVERDAAHQLGLLRAHPLGLLITLSAPAAQGSGASGPPAVVANPVPWLVRRTDGGNLPEDPVGADADPRTWRLVGHVARANPVWRDADPSGEVLVVFQGPQAYVSPGWYPSKSQHGKVVPTWNYATVQVRGRLIVRDDPVWLHALVSRLSDHHEAPLPKPWAVTDAPNDYVQQMISAIVGLEIEVHAVAAKFKFSQNRAEADRDGVRQGLARRPMAEAQAVAQAMATVSTPPRGGT